jgi:drug/metabolite transporter (DMT)-like permease
MQRHGAAERRARTREQENEMSAPQLTTQGDTRRGYYYAGLNAVISGFAIFINSYGVKLFADSTLYTTLKNAVVGIALLIPLMLFSSRRAEWGSLRPKQWALLLMLAVIGGSVPYALFFRGLQLTTPVTSSLINHAQFLIVALLAILLLRERIGPLMWGALLLLLVGTTLGLNIQAVRWNEGAALVAVSTLLFAVGVVLAKHLLRNLSTLTVMTAKMSIGSLFLLGYVAYTGRLGAVATLSLTQWAFVVGTGLILLAFTVTAFLALRYTTATAATAIPAAAPIITTALVIGVTQQIKLAPIDQVGLALTAIAVIAIITLGWRRGLGVWQAHERAPQEVGLA